MQGKKVTIIGLGLIGGSIARALREKLDISDITVINRNPDAIAQAIKDGTATRGFHELNDYVFNSDLIFICTPVKRTIEYISELSNKVKPGCIITDVGSTKSEIIQFVNQMSSPPLFIGGHPMAGAEKTGYSASFSHLYENAYYILTPCKSTTTEATSLMKQLIEGIGAIPVILDANDHDKITASISHVPHVISSALVNLVQQSDSSDNVMRTLAAGGFKDITRIASSSPEMWENIVLSNSAPIKEVLLNYIEILKTFICYIDTNNSKSIYSFLESAKVYRDSFSSTKKGLLKSEYEIVVDVKDKPGIIGQIATLLGENLVNIKNINVSNSREFEQGCLRITLPDSNNLNIAFDLLEKKGYKVYKYC